MKKIIRITYETTVDLEASCIDEAVTWFRENNEREFKIVNVQEVSGDQPQEKAL
jgi:hypothetical protein